MIQCTEKHVFISIKTLDYAQESRLAVTGVVFIVFHFDDNFFTEKAILAVHQMTCDTRPVIERKKMNYRKEQIQ